MNQAAPRSPFASSEYTPRVGAGLAAESLPEIPAQVARASAATSALHDALSGLESSLLPVSCADGANGSKAASAPREAMQSELGGLVQGVGDGIEAAIGRVNAMRAALRV